MPFDYLAAATIDQAAVALAGHPGDARVVAGGTDVMVQYRDRRIAPDLIVSLHRVPGLERIEVGDEVRIGPLVTATQVIRHSDVQARYPALIEGARMVGAWLIQNRATLAGNLCNASPAADTTPALLAHFARVRLTGPAGDREIPLDHFFTGPGRTVRKKGEILTEIVLPVVAPRSASAYYKLSPRGAMDIAIVGVAVQVALDTAGDRIEEIGIALGAVAPTPIRAIEAEAVLRGRTVRDDLLAEAARAARSAARPISDIRGSAAYRSAMVETLVRRVVRTAIARARMRQ
ncbi:MAG TPA: FAD binding domain-containing protein [Dehalococcoidia bacterium]|nr:FAD binding domain-containing protein [Dehalococcoidia bacterium]